MELINEGFGNVTVAQQTDLFLELKTQKEMFFKITCHEENVWRIQSKLNDSEYIEGAAQLLDKDYGGGDNLTGCKFKVRNCEGVYTLSSDKISSKLNIILKPFNVSLIDNNDKRKIDLFDFSYDKNIIQVSGSLSEKERLFGTGQRFNSINQKGRDLIIWSEDKWCETEGNSYVPLPYIISTKKYAVILNRYEAAKFDLGYSDKDKWTIQQIDAPLDMYIQSYEDPKTLYNNLGLLLGFSPEPPEWGYGAMMCRHINTGDFNTVENIKKYVANMEAKNLQYTTIIIEPWPIYDIEKQKEIKEFVDDMHSQGKKVMVWEACGRFYEANWADYDGKAEYFIKNKEGSHLLKNISYFNPADAADQNWISSSIDVTNEKAMDWWKNRVWGYLMDELKIDGAKIDFCEQLTEDIELHSGRNPKGMHHYFSVKYNMEMLKMFNEKRSEGGVCFTRGGGIGAHRHPFMWCGDQLREYRFLKAILNAVISSGISGIPFMAHDLAGYTMPGNGDNEANVFVRGTELSAFTFNMQTHGTVTRPYDFEDDVVDIFRVYTEIHYLLIPYISEQSKITCSTGMPLIRHLHIMYPNDANVWDIEDQFFLGEDLLVAPVLDNVVKRDIYLPEGEWENIFNEEVYKGPCTLKEHEVEMHEIPVFVNAKSKSKVLETVLKEIKPLYLEYVGNIKK